MKSVDLTPWVHLKVVVYNLGHSPWNTDARYAAMKESTEEYLDHMSGACPLLPYFTDDLTKDFGLEAEMGTRTSWTAPWSTSGLTGTALTRAHR